MKPAIYAVERPTRLPDWAEEIVRGVAKRRRTTVADILSNSYFPEHVAARAEALFLIAEKGRLSGRRTAKLFRKDWFGVCRLIRRHRALIAQRSAA